MATNTAGSSLYSYTVASHLAAEFDVPFTDFALAHPQYNFFIVAGFVFTKRPHSQPLPASASEYAKQKHSSSSSTSKSGGKNEPLMLIIQRALNDSYGGYWDFPGGSLEPHDQTILDGVAREVLEETGLHVSRIRDIVRIDTWIASKSRMLMAAKFSFVVDVHEAADTVGWEEEVKLAPDEHVKWLWVTEEEIEESAKAGQEGLAPPYAFVGVQGETAWEAFKTYLRLESGPRRARLIEEAAVEAV